MNATGFGKKYGMKYVRKIHKWNDLGYLGNTTQDIKTKEYSIPDDIPLPYSANSNVTYTPTLWRDMLDAAAHSQSMFSTMYPKLPEGEFDDQLQNLVNAGFIKIKQTKSGDSYLSLQPAGQEFKNKLNDKEQKDILGKVNKLVTTGWTLIQAFNTVWPFIAPYLSQIVH